MPSDADGGASAEAPREPVVTVAEPHGSAAPDTPLRLDTFTEVWPAIVESLEGDYPKLAACLRQARPAGVADGELTLAWASSSAFLKRIAEDPANREAVAGAIRAVAGTSVRLTHELRADEELGADDGATTISEEELIARFVAEFDAEELPPDDPQESEA